MKADTMVREILGRKSSKSCLKKDDLRNVAKNLPIMSWISESDAPANWFNPEWLDFVGRTEKSMQNWAYQDFHHPDYLAPTVTKRFEATNAGIVWEDTFPLLGRDKKFHWLLSRAVPILDENNQTAFYFGFHIDVTDKIPHPKLTQKKTHKTYFL